MLAGWRELSAGIGATLCFLLFFWLLYSQPPKEGKELEVGMCEITALNRDLSHPRRMIARQTARCACRRGQVAGTMRAKPACVDGLLTAAADGLSLVPPLLAAAAVYHLPGAMGQPLCPHPGGLVSLQQGLASLCSAPPGPGGLALLPAWMMPNSWKDVGFIPMEWISVVQRGFN
nr:chemokine-like protein TAFA-3 isoform X2 [Caretta caretta]